MGHPTPFQAVASDLARSANTRVLQGWSREHDLQQEGVLMEQRTSTFATATVVVGPRGEGGEGGEGGVAWLLQRRTGRGDWAFERYNYKSTDTPRDGGAAMEDTGWGLVIYHRDADGKWRVARDAFGSDQPLPTPQ